MSEFNPGDQVQLKSGGPVMTVESAANGSVNCIWFEGKPQAQRVMSHSFPEVVLEKYEPSVGFYTI
jgi:uncharacterized protein YodC (DUF2158 family)